MDFKRIKKGNQLCPDCKFGRLDNIGSDIYFCINCHASFKGTIDTEESIEETLDSIK